MTGASLMAAHSRRLGPFWSDDGSPCLPELPALADSGPRQAGAGRAPRSSQPYSTTRLPANGVRALAWVTRPGPRAVRNPLALGLAFAATARPAPHEILRTGERAPNAALTDARLQAKRPRSGDYYGAAALGSRRLHRASLAWLRRRRQVATPLRRRVGLRRC